MRPCLLLLSIVLPFVVCRSSLSCWTGTQNWERGINDVSVTQCQPHHRCCSFYSSLNGNDFACYDACPADGVEQCGPDPKLGFQDIHYCYCKDYKDKKCQPYLGEE